MIACDVLVIGGGLSARRCAQLLAQKYDVLLIQDGAGASPYIHGLCVPLAEGDSTELFIRDTMESGKHQNNPELVRALCEGAAALAKEFDFDRRADGEYDLLRPLGASVARVASIHEHTGAHIMRQIADNKRFRERDGVRAMRLLTKENRVLGALCYDRKTNRWECLLSRAVCLATGGFGGIFPFSTNSSDIGGDGIAMAYEAGAELCDMEFIQFEPTAALSPSGVRGKGVITTMLFEGACFKNARGERFLELECVDKDILSKEIYREILRGGGTKHGGVYYDATGVDAEVLHKKYQSYYERYRRVGVDITKSPMEVAPAPHTTLGGVVIDAKCRTTLEGLFAMGEVTGGLHGANRLGGNAGLETLVFGKIAAQSVDEYLDKCGELPVAFFVFGQKNARFAKKYLHKRVKEIASEALGVIRCREKMEKGRSEILCILDTLRPLCTKNGCLSFDAMRAYNDALTVYLTLEAALLREGSVGAHEREDAIAESEKYTVFLSKQYLAKKETIV